jgi:hypothetical protein
MCPIAETAGFLVADVDGRVVGHVESPLYGTSPDEPDALAIRSGRLLHRHFIVHARAIETIDEGSHAIGLRLQRAELQRFF